MPSNKKITSILFKFVTQYQYLFFFKLTIQDTMLAFLFMYLFLFIYLFIFIYLFSLFIFFIYLFLFNYLFTYLLFFYYFFS